MIVDLRSVLDSPRHFNLTLEADWWQGNGEEDQILGLDGPLEAALSISKAGGAKSFMMPNISLTGQGAIWITP